MSDKRWKRHERVVAAALGTKRNPNDGSRKTDIDAGPFAIEHKVRKRLPRLILDAVEQARISAQPGKTPLVVLSEANRGKKTERFVVMRFRDWLDWYGRIGHEDPEGGHTSERA